jgi:rhodanese-related sulfurtransferase
MRFKLAYLLACSLVTSTLTSASAIADVPQTKQTKLAKYLTAKETSDLLKDGRAKILFVDVRTRAELTYVGWTNEIDGQVPYVEISEFWDWDTKNNRFKLDLNQSFGAGVEKLLKAKGLTKADKVIVMCRSGDRSSRAVNLLADLGYSDAWSVIDGFEGDLSQAGYRTVNGWKNSGLPWTYKLDKSKLYLPRQ